MKCQQCLFMIWARFKNQSNDHSYSGKSPPQHLYTLIAIALILQLDDECNG